MEKRIRRQYTADYKAQAVSLADSLGAAEAARKLAISVKTLANWVRTGRTGEPVGGGLVCLRHCARCADDAYQVSAIKDATATCQALSMRGDERAGVKYSYLPLGHQ